MTQDLSSHTLNVHANPWARAHTAVNHALAQFDVHGTITDDELATLRTVLNALPLKRSRLETAAGTYREARAAQKTAKTALAVLRDASAPTTRLYRAQDALDEADEDVLDALAELRRAAMKAEC